MVVATFSFHACERDEMTPYQYEVKLQHRPCYENTWLYFVDHKGVQRPRVNGASIIEDRFR